MGFLDDIAGTVDPLDLTGARADKKFMDKGMKKQSEAIQAMLALQQQGMDTSSKMFGQSEAQLNAVGPAYRQQILAQGQQDVAAASQSALSTGLAGTSAHAGMGRGARADASRNLGMLEEQLAGARSRLYERRGSEVYSQFIDRANIRQRTKYDPFLANWQPGQNNMLKDVAQLAGAAAGGGM